MDRKRKTPIRRANGAHATAVDITLIRRRLWNQRILANRFRHAAEVVSWFGAVQAQDFACAKWAVGVRAEGLTDLSVEEAFNNGEIVRTHVLRPTWHFVAPSDVRWMLALTGPRVAAANGYFYRQHGVDASMVRRSRKVLERALRDGTFLTRGELVTLLDEEGVAGDPLRYIGVLMQAELDGLICSGPRRGKHFTYALLEERVPKASGPAGDEALAELTRRYFRSHGPATARDFSWWSGLTMREVNRGMAITRPELEVVAFAGLDYAVIGDAPSAKDAGTQQGGALLPQYDEYLVAYKERALVTGGSGLRTDDPRATVLGQAVVIDGRITATWRRTVDRRTVSVEVTPYGGQSKDEDAATAEAAQRYAAFLQKELRVINAPASASGRRPLSRARRAAPPA